jgi:hypothetical protein
MRACLWIVVLLSLAVAPPAQAQGLGGTTIVYTWLDKNYSIHIGRNGTVNWSEGPAQFRLGKNISGSYRCPGGTPACKCQYGRFASLAGTVLTLQTTVTCSEPILASNTGSAIGLVVTITGDTCSIRGALNLVPSGGWEIRPSSCRVVAGG